MYFYLSKILAPLLNLTNLIFFLIILGTLLNFFYRKKKIKIFVIFNIFLLLTTTILPLGKFGLKYLEKDYLVQQKINNIDNIVILAGSENIYLTHTTKKLNLNNSSERLIASIKLANENSNAKIYFLGGDGNLKKHKIDETFVAKNFYNDVAFDITRVNFINNTRNTIENLTELKKIIDLDKNNVLITSAFHMKRTMFIAKQMNIKLTPYAVDFRYGDNFSLINFYQHFSISSNLRSVDLFFREFIGILAFKLFY